jgi:signal transduction histidine kinase/ActR/RegA family two-component response regulator
MNDSASARPDGSLTATVAAERKQQYYSLLYKEMAERKRAESELRKNNTMLSALSHAQLRFVSGVEITRVFADLLDSLLTITHSESGLIGEVSEEQEPRLEILAKSATDVYNSYDPVQIADAVSDVIATRKPVLTPVDFRNQPSNPLLTQVDLTASVRTFLALPFYNGDSVVGIVGLVQRPAEDDVNLVDFMQPTLSTCAQLIAAHRNEQLRQQAELALEEERALLAQRIAERTAELRAANAELVYAARAKDEFLATMNHELRTPLHAILLLAESLQLEVYGPLSERQLRPVNGILESGRHLLSLINDILDVAKIEAGKLRMAISPCMVGDVCHASERLIVEMAHKKGLTLTVDIDPAVKMIEADETRLKQMLVNLLGNAVKFTPAGGAIGLEVAGDREHNVARFSVWDTGIGIAQEDMVKLFQPFVRLDSSHARPDGGTGLGLVLVSRMAQMHGGSVVVESQPDVGSKFTILLPWHPQAAPLEHETGETALSEPASLAQAVLPAGENTALYGTGAPADWFARRRQPLILLADDNEIGVSALSNYLLSEGYRLITAKNGRDAVELTRQRRPDLILMDTQMPELNGLEATRQIRSDPDIAAIPIIALTALAMVGDRERCLAAGANEYVSKPVLLSELKKAIDTQLHDTQLNRDAASP